MEKVEVFSKECISCNLLLVEAGTNCPQGGDSGHGGRTVVRFTDQAGTDMRLRIDKGPLCPVSCVELVFGGDSEHSILIEALEFVVQVLTKTNHHTEEIE